MEHPDPFNMINTPPEAKDDKDSFYSNKSKEFQIQPKDDAKVNEAVFDSTDERDEDHTKNNESKSGEMKEIKELLLSLMTEVKDLKNQVTSIKQERDQLKEKLDSSQPDQKPVYDEINFPSIKKNNLEVIDILKDNDSSNDRDI